MDIPIIDSEKGTMEVGGMDLFLDVVDKTTNDVEPISYI